MKIKFNRQRSIVAAALALVFSLMLTATFPVYAASGTEDITEIKFNVDVDISWGEMSFTYTPEHAIWNPTTHAYDDKIEAAWTIKGNDITVTNVGTNGIRADFAVTLNEAATGASAGFKAEANAETSVETYSMELVGNEGESTTGTVYLDISGVISETYTELATVTITIIAE